MKNYRIIIVDDEQSITFALKEYLKNHEFEVDCASELEEAEAMVANNFYSAAILDLRLTGTQGMEGLELIRFIREKSPNTRLIIMTAYGSQEIENETRRRGADVFLHKPQTLLKITQIMLELLKENR